MRRIKRSAFVSALILISVCQPEIEADILIKNGQVFIGDNTKGRNLHVALLGDTVIYVGVNSNRVNAKRTIDAKGLYVIPGFIDPHTHSLGELTNADPEIRENRNYRYQGVTTVIYGNDGFGAQNNKTQLNAFETTGLFYAPGSFSKTDEVIALAKIAADSGGIYDSHARDEASYNIGLEAAIDEVITIARDANIPANIAHIKALGADVWGLSKVLIPKIKAARQEGLKITADQYPWQASGTRISNALIPRWIKAGTQEAYKARLNDPQLQQHIIDETTENLRKRGGSDTVLIMQKNSD